MFEVDRPGPQTWKRERLTELGYGIPPWLRLVPVDFEADGSWWDRLVAAGFDAAEPAVVGLPRPQTDAVLGGLVIKRVVNPVAAGAPNDP